MNYYSYHSCRFCKHGEGGVIGPLMKYAVRHYICAACFLGKGWSFDRLSIQQLNQFPALIAQDHGRYDELGLAIKVRQAIQLHRELALEA